MRGSRHGGQGKVDAARAGCELASEPVAPISINRTHRVRRSIVAAQQILPSLGVQRAPDGRRAGMTRRGGGEGSVTVRAH